MTASRPDPRRSAPNARTDARTHASPHETQAAAVARADDPFHPGDDPAAEDDLLADFPDGDAIGDAIDDGDDDWDDEAGDKPLDAREPADAGDPIVIALHRRAEDPAWSNAVRRLAALIDTSGIACDHTPQIEIAENDVDLLLKGIEETCDPAGFYAAILGWRAGDPGERDTLAIKLSSLSEVLGENTLERRAITQAIMVALATIDPLLEAEAVVYKALESFALDHPTPEDPGVRHAFTRHLEWLCGNFRARINDGGTEFIDLLSEVARALAAPTPCLSAEECAEMALSLAPGWVTAKARLEVDCKAIISMSPLCALSWREAMLHALARADAQRDPRTGAPGCVDQGTSWRLCATRPPESDAQEVDTRYAELFDPLPLSPRRIGADLLAELLLRDVPWMGPLAAAARTSLKLAELAGQPWFHLEPLLIVGPPGCGKTAAARRIAQIAGVPSSLHDCGGKSTAAQITGTPRGYASAQPALPLLAAHQTGCANPILLLDEIDKAAASSHNGRIADSLLQFLEPESAGKLYDDCLLTTCDVRAISFILLANRLDDVPAPLRSRCRVVEVAQPGPGHAEAAVETLERDLRAHLGWPVDTPLPLAPAARRQLVAAARRGASLRRLKRALHEAVAQTPDTGPQIRH